MIELLDTELLGKLRPDTASFLIKYAIKAYQKKC